MIQSPNSGFGFENGLIFNNGSDGKSFKLQILKYKTNLQGLSGYGIRASSEGLDRRDQKTLARYAIDGNLTTYWAPEIRQPDYDYEYESFARSYPPPNEQNPNAKGTLSMTYQ